MRRGGGRVAGVQRGRGEAEARACAGLKEARACDAAMV